MTHFLHYLSGHVFGIKYIFDTVDDGLPRHAHDAVTAHNVVVLQGEVKVLFDDQTKYLRAGDIYDFDGARQHAIRAVTPDACILNLFLNGQPVEYQARPPHELKGEFNVRDFRS
jgi:quercetin dioxygenase-like cupin family protein